MSKKHGLQQALRDAIARARDAGRSQAAIAEAAGISAGRLSDFVNGKCDLYTASASRLAEALNLRLLPARTPVPSKPGPRAKERSRPRA